VQTLSIVAPAPVEHGNNLVDLVVSAEVDGGICLLKWLEAGIGAIGELEGNRCLKGTLRVG